YFGRADGTVEDRAAALGIADGTRYHSGWSPIAADLDNDGDLDLYVPNSTSVRNDDELQASVFDPTFAAAGLSDVLFTGGADARFDFAEVPYRRTLASPVLAAVADYDGDGLLDVAEAQNAQGLRLLHNTTAAAGN